MAKRVQLHSYFEADYLRGMVDPNVTVRNRYAHAFYEYCRNYFKAHYRSVFFMGEEECRQILDDSFLELWTKVDSGLICVKQDCVYINGKPATGKLTTFLMSIAKNKYREWVRDLPKDDDPEQLMDFVQKDVVDEPYESESDRIYDAMVEQLSNLSEECFRLLSFFYYEELKLEQILERMTTYTNTDSLKTKKSKCMKTLRQRMAPYEKLFYK